MIITLACTWQQAQAFVIIGQEDFEPYLTLVQSACDEENFKLANEKVCDLVFLLGVTQVILGENTHQKITKDALKNLNWKIESNGSFVGFVDEALLEIAEANEKVELVQTPDRHFDAEAFYAANSRLKTLRFKVINQLRFFTPAELANSATVLERGAEARQYFGQLLHTLQDFYAHSNWVEQQIEAGNASNPNVLDRLGLPGLNFSRSENNVICDEFSLGAIELTSGDYLGESPWSFFPSPLGTACDSRANKCAHGPNWLASINNSSCGINKDAAGRTHNDLAVLLAKNHSAFFANHLVSEIRKYYGEDKFMADAAVCAFLGVSYTEIACQKQLTIQKYRKDTVEVIAGGKVEVVSGPIDCGETCSGPLLTGSRVELKASSKGGFNFVRWHIDSEVCRGSTNPDCIVTMDTDKVAKAVFEPPNCISSLEYYVLWRVSCTNVNGDLVSKEVTYARDNDGTPDQQTVTEIAMESYLPGAPSYSESARWKVTINFDVGDVPIVFSTTPRLFSKSLYEEIPDGAWRQTGAFSLSLDGEDNTTNASMSTNEYIDSLNHTDTGRNCAFGPGGYARSFVQVIVNGSVDNTQSTYEDIDASACPTSEQGQSINSLRLEDSIIYQCVQMGKTYNNCPLAPY